MFEYIHSSFPEQKHSPEFKGMIVFELFDQPSTFQINFVVVELAFVFELFEAVVVTFWLNFRGNFS